MAQLVNSDSKYANEMEKSDGETYNDYFLRQEVLMKKILAESDATPPGTVIGAVLSWPVADGKAFYQVVSEKPLRLQHIPFGDSYMVSHIMIRGLRIGDVRNMVEMNRRRAVMWAKK